MLRGILILLLLLGCKSGKEKQGTSLTYDLEQIACLNNVLEKDSVLGQIRNHSSENISVSQTIVNYTHDLKSLNYSNCPEKFVVAFKMHIQAWLDLRKITDKHLSLRGELHDIFSVLETSEDSIEFKALVKNILDTWSLVEKNSKYR